MNTPTDFRASLLDLRRSIDIAIGLLDMPQYLRDTTPSSPAEGFCLGNWRIVPRFPQNTPSEATEASRDAFVAWWLLHMGECRELAASSSRAIDAWLSWQASRAQLNSPSHQ